MLHLRSQIKYVYGEKLIYVRIFYNGLTLVSTAYLGNGEYRGHRYIFDTRSGFTLIDDLVMQG